MPLPNIAVKLCGILQSESSQEITAREWRLLGQEQDGSQIFSWQSTGAGNSELLNIGVYTHKTKTLEKLHVFKEKLNIIQASVNSSRTLLVYVVKSFPNEEQSLNKPLYCPFLIPLLACKENEPIQIEDGSTKQTMVQYIYGKSLKYTPGERKDRFLLLRHLECIKVYHTKLTSKDNEDGFEDWSFDSKIPDGDVIVKSFCWAQWDCVNQVLYYIHHRAPAQSFAEGDEVKSPSDVTPMMTALQFHADLPHETVLNIPLNLPHGGAVSGEGSSDCGTYSDAPVPLRLHDCSLDLRLLCDAAAPVLCLAHHYLYKPLAPTSELEESLSSLLDSMELREGGVNFAYSVTLLHVGRVVHAVVPDLPWAMAKALRPAYTFYGDQLLVYIPNLFIQLLDVSPAHDSSSHIIIPTKKIDIVPSLAPLIGWQPNTMVDLQTLNVWNLSVEDDDLVDTFKKSCTVENKLGVIHYLILHEGNFELAEELISWQCVNQGSNADSLDRVMQEYLVASAHALTARSLPPSAQCYMAVVPFTQHLKLADVRIGELSVSVTQEKLWNSSVVVLPPRQRLCQFAEDLWTRLWTTLNPAKRYERFKQSTVKEKLAVSLQCYQPEAISRCTTPRSPVGSMGSVPTLPTPGRAASLPFFEIDVCTASKQEHVTAQNIRVAGLALNALGGAGGGAGGGGGGARWGAAAQLASRALCAAVCRAAAANNAAPHRRGFTFV